MHAIASPVAFLSVLSLTVAQAPPAAPLTADAVLPASTYAAMRFGGLAACREATEGMPIAAAVRTFLSRVPAEVRDEHLEEGFTHAAAALQEGCEQLGLRPSDVRAVASRPMTLAVGRLSIEGWGPSVALVIDAGEQRKAINRVVQVGAQFVAEQAGGAQSSQLELGGHSFHALLLQDGPSLFAGGIGNLYVITNSRGYLAEIVDVAARKQPSLGATTRLDALAAELPAPALASLFVNADRVLSAFAPHMPYEASAWADALGVGNVDALYAGVTATAAGGSDVFHLGIGGKTTGLCKALLASPADLSFARACSANTVWFGAYSVDVPAVVDAFERFVELLPATARKELVRELRRELGRDLRRVGTSIEEVDTTLRAFGNQVAFALALEKGAVPKPELIARIAVRDAAHVAKLLQRVETLVSEEAGVEWKVRKAGEHDVRFCNVQLPEAQFQLSPCYLLTQDALWLGSDAAALVRAMRQDEESSLASQPDFVELAQHASGASAVGTLRLFRAVEIGWRTMETIVYPMIDGQQERLGFGSEALPDQETLAKALGTSSSVLRVDEHGVTSHAYGSLTMGQLLAAFGLLGDEVLARAAGKVH